MSLFGSIFGDSKDVDASQAPNKLANISEQLLQETSPLRQALISRYSNFLGVPQGAAPVAAPTTTPTGGGYNLPPGAIDRGEYVEYFAPGTSVGNAVFLPKSIFAAPAQAPVQQASVQQPVTPATSTPFDVATLPQFASLKDAIDRQFNIAKNNVIATTSPGGAMTAALGNLEGTRAATKVSGIASLADQEMARAFALGTGTTPTALGGLGSAASALGNIGMAQAAQQAQAMSGLGYGIGSSMGRKGASSGAKNATQVSAVG